VEAPSGGAGRSLAGWEERGGGGVRRSGVEAPSGAGRSLAGRGHVIFLFVVFSQF
jgi:hypothetical protein